MFPTFLYNIFISLYTTSIKLAASWNPKAKLWVIGRKKWPEFNSSQPKIWMHCASLGEFEQGRPVLEKIKQQYPNYPIVLSFFSPSGYEVRKNYPGADHVIYLPADTKKNAENMLDAINPAYVIFVKYEYWFHHINAIKKRKIPLVLIAAKFRKNQPFFKWYGSFWKRMLHNFSHIFVQDHSSLDLLKSISIHHSSIAGDPRFDRVVATAAEKISFPTVESFIKSNHVLVCGSTWLEDETIIAAYSKKNPDLQIIIAPHEIKSSNIERLKQEFVNPVLYSELSKKSNSETYKVLIIDNIGLLAYLYKYAAIAYIGGGFNQSGIHNSLEAAVFGKPMLWGPHYDKFGEAVELVNAGAAFSIKDYSSFNNEMTNWLGNNELMLKAGKEAENYVKLKTGATEIILQHITKTFS